ncbi:MAG TPA: class I SAM-dependent methyltransferase [Hyphomicrobiaceae bacterium]|nr:class I SAM-dependent methyltransferase [Hyphomicrobiaceae bacterium]
MTVACPVCRQPEALYFMAVDGLEYWRCQQCEARFLDPRYLPDAAMEHAHYLHHENDPGDLDYRRFLSRLSEPLLARLGAGPLSGLDYGCGPGPALAGMLGEAGHKMAVYDPFFAPDEGPLSETYDFITCTEAAEHFHTPAAEFDRFDAMLCPGGWLGVMTCFQTDDDRFARWHYRADPTHVVFYRAETFRFIASARGWACEVPAKDIVLMRKPRRTPA